MNKNQGISSAYFVNSLYSGEIEDKKDAQLSKLWTSLKISIGSLIIKGYRIFKYMLDKQTIIFTRREQYRTKYLLFKIALSKQDQLKPQFYNSALDCIEQISKFRKRDLEDYSFLLYFLSEYSLIQLKKSKQTQALLQTNENLSYRKIIQILPTQTYTEETFFTSYSGIQQVAIPLAQDEKKKVKQIVYSYIDTFGDKYKTNYYSHLQKVAFYLFNTINLIIFEETRPKSKNNNTIPNYNQIQSSSWTAFKEGMLKSDRKDIVLSGSGRILIIDLVFEENINSYLNDQYYEEVYQLYRQCKKQYKDSVVKIIQINKQLSLNYVYPYREKIVNHLI